MRKRRRGLKGFGRAWGFEGKFTTEHTERTEIEASRKKITRRGRGRRGSAEKERRKREEKGTGRRGEDGLKRRDLNVAQSVETRNAGPCTPVSASAAPAFSTRADGELPRCPLGAN